MRKTCFLAAALLLVFVTLLAHSQSDSLPGDVPQVESPSSDGVYNGSEEKPAVFEAGVIIGEPSGLSAKYWLTRLLGVDAGIAWSFSEDGKLDIFGDFLLHPYYIPIDQGDFPAYVGAGAAFRVGDGDSFLGVRFPVGVQFLWNTFPLSVFAEVAPIMEVIPDIGARVEGGAGLRFAFGRSER
jgi:hypothetical protein